MQVLHADGHVVASSVNVGPAAVVRLAPGGDRTSNRCRSRTDRSSRSGSAATAERAASRWSSAELGDGRRDAAGPSRSCSPSGSRSCSSWSASSRGCRRAGARAGRGDPPEVEAISAASCTDGCRTPGKDEISRLAATMNACSTRLEEAHRVSAGSSPTRRTSCARRSPRSASTRRSRCRIRTDDAARARGGRARGGRASPADRRGPAAPDAGGRGDAAAPRYRWTSTTSSSRRPRGCARRPARIDSDGVSAGGWWATVGSSSGWCAT